MSPDIVGVWQLRSFHDVDDVGQTVEGPLGPNPMGMLIYTADGHVSVSMMRTSLGPAPTFMGYAGRWHLVGDRVAHRIQVSSRPDWVDVEQTRDAELEGDYLTVRATRQVEGRPQQRMLVWHRKH